MHFYNLKDQFPSWVEEWRLCITSNVTAECIPSNIVMLDRNVARKYDGSHLKATKKDAAPYCTYVQ